MEAPLPHAAELSDDNDDLFKGVEKHRIMCVFDVTLIPETCQRGGSVASQNRSKAAHGISQIAADANARPSSRTGN